MRAIRPAKSIGRVEKQCEVYAACKACHHGNIRKKPTLERNRPSSILKEKRLTVLLSLEAVQAQNRASTFGLRTWLEWHFAIGATTGAGCCVHLACAHALVLALIATSLAALWSSETAFLVKRLLTLCEGEIGATVAAGDLLISHTEKRKRK
jgi:hypothetical protein